MKDEIKEKMTIGKAKKILRGFLAKDCYYDTPLYYAIPYLLDHITNLQGYYNDNVNKYEELIEKYSNLQEENVNLKTKLRWKENRIDKAIEKLYCYGEIFDGKILQQFQKEMLETLQGKSDE